MAATPPGTERLCDYLARRKLTVYAFAKRTGIPCDHLQKIVKGKRRRISVDMAIDLDLATGGYVPFYSWRMREPPQQLQDKRPTPLRSLATTEAPSTGVASPL